MKTKPLTFLLALTFLLLFGSSSKGGIFSPNDWYECIFENMKDAKNTSAVVYILRSCNTKFPGERKKGPSGFLDPKNESECVLKYTKGVEIDAAVQFIVSACESKFKENTDSFWVKV